MKLIIGEQHIEYKGKPSADKVIEQINEYVTEGQYFSHFIADGAEIYDEHENYLEQNIGTIQELQVMIKTEKEFVNDIILSAEEYLSRAIPEVKELVGDFQNGPTGETWERFDMLLGGIGWLNDMLELVYNSAERPSNYEAFSKLQAGLQEGLSNLEKAVESERNEQISSVVKADILVVFEGLKETIKKTIDAELVRDHLN